MYSLCKYFTNVWQLHLDRMLIFVRAQFHVFRECSFTPKLLNCIQIKRQRSYGSLVSLAGAQRTSIQINVMRRTEDKDPVTTIYFS